MQQHSSRNRNGVAKITCEFSSHFISAHQERETVNRYLILHIFTVHANISLFSFSQSSKANQSVNSHEDDFSRQQSIIKQGWSTLTALHTVLLPDCVVAAGANTYQPPMVEILARRWQDRCQEVRLTRVEQK